MIEHDKNEKTEHEGFTELECTMQAVTWNTEAKVSLWRWDMSKYLQEWEVATWTALGGTSRQREQPGQSPWVGNVPGLFQEATVAEAQWVEGK